MRPRRNLRAIRAWRYVVSYALLMLLLHSSSAMPDSPASGGPCLGGVAMTGLVLALWLARTRF